jgi:cysteine desulfurase family protein (TIGR01976 family)
MKILAPPDLDRIRACFPSLASETVFLENAGGSQVPSVVADAVHRYLQETYVQLGADYPLSLQCTRIVNDAHDAVRRFMGGDDIGEVVLGASTSALFRTLADAYADTIEKGDEIVLAEGGHEANIAPWLRLERQGAKIRWWSVEAKTGASTLTALEKVLSDRTRIVAFPHVSNLLGEVIDVEAVTTMAHRAGARVVVDGVAYAPHRLVDVARWGVDWYGYSSYKVYGPHLGVLFGTHAAFKGLVGPNYYFIPDDEVPYKWELGGVNHEGCAGLVALDAYLAHVAGTSEGGRETVVAATARWEALEQPLQERLVRWLRDHPRVRLVGPDTWGSERVPTVSFVHNERTSREIALAANAEKLGIRHGHMYAHRLCLALRLDPNDGVVRISAVHYNSPAEIERLIAVLDPLL